MSTLFQSIPATDEVRKVAPSEGEKFDIAGAHLTWTVKGADSGYSASAKQPHNCASMVKSTYYE